MLNMFTLVVTQQFEQFYFNPDNPITSFEEIADEFRIPWNLFTHNTKGQKMSEALIVDFFAMLKHPLGYKFNDEDMEKNYLSHGESMRVETIISRTEIAKEIVKMNMPIDNNGDIPFGVVLHATIKNAYGKKYLDNIEKEAYKMIKKAEILCIAEIVSKYLKKQALLRKPGQEKIVFQTGNGQKTANPF